MLLSQNMLTQWNINYLYKLISVFIFSLCHYDIVLPKIGNFSESDKVLN